MWQVSNTPFTDHLFEPQTAFSKGNNQAGPLLAYGITSIVSSFEKKHVYGVKQKQQNFHDA
jgi:hypothetical protein